MVRRARRARSWRHVLLPSRSSSRPRGPRAAATTPDALAQRPRPGRRLRRPGRALRHRPDHRARRRRRTGLRRRRRHPAVPGRRPARPRRGRRRRRRRPDRRARRDGGRRGRPRRSPCSPSAAASAGAGAGAAPLVPLLLLAAVGAARLPAGRRRARDGHRPRSRPLGWALGLWACWLVCAVLAAGRLLGRGSPAAARVVAVRRRRRGRRARRRRLRRRGPGAHPPRPRRRPAGRRSAAAVGFEGDSSVGERTLHPVGRPTRCATATSWAWASLVVDLRQADLPARRPPRRPPRSASARPSCSSPPETCAWRRRVASAPARSTFFDRDTGGIDVDVSTTARRLARATPRASSCGADVGIGAFRVGYDDGPGLERGDDWASTGPAPRPRGEGPHAEGK